MRDYNIVPNRFNPHLGSQEHQVSKSFFEKPMTRTMVEYEIGVPVKNVDRIVHRLLRSDSLFVVRKGECEITKMPEVIYYSNNPKFHPPNLPTQLSLF